MSIYELKKHLRSLVGHVTFDYNGHSCGIDPLAKDLYALWYGDNEINLTSVDEVISLNFFYGKSLEDIWNNITNLFF